MGSLFIIYFNASFAKYGKNGTAAGISNAASSFGIVLLNYGVLKISDLWGWDAVHYLWLGLAAVFLLSAVGVLLINKQFRAKEAKNGEI
jgi:sugar phosphate permease